MNAISSPPPHSIFSLGIAGKVLTFRTRARLSFAPPTCRMPLGPSQASPKLIPEAGSAPGFDIAYPETRHRKTLQNQRTFHRSGWATRPWQLIRFRHFRSGSLALASLNRTCQNLVPTFPQRSLPWLLTTAACGGLRSTPDCRPRRAFLHLSYSYASPCGPALLVTQDPERTDSRNNDICDRVCKARQRT